MTAVRHGSTSNEPAHHNPHAPATRTLRKTSSFADLAKKHLKRLRNRGEDFDFGCQGDAHAQDSFKEDDEEDEPTLAPRRPTVRSSLPFATVESAPPSRPAAPLEVLDERDFSPQQLQELRRKKEEALAADACVEYMQTHTTHRRQHSRTHSRSSSNPQNLFPLPTMFERLNLHDHRDEPTVTAYAGVRPRADSTSSLCSSRPRTNDSLPSFAGSDAATYSSAGSYPPSPVQTSRPTFASPGVGAAAVVSRKLDTSDPAHQPRAYAFI
ncbi:uncharacterized protein JCM15063_003870 [Sporobolomyces koalae]|uniref:uncharacterized protein n=1 Tax=Sporobolomyces koalae TaxID=500713 RepID=UPI0031755B2B